MVGVRIGGGTGRSTWHTISGCVGVLSPDSLDNYFSYLVYFNHSFVWCTFSPCGR